MAVGVHLTHPPSGVAVGGLVAVGVSGTRLAVYVTEDAGATWRETFAPAPAMDAGPLDVIQQGDAALLFDPDGTIHLSALARVARFGDTEDTNGVNELRVYYVQSDDLGRTWSEPVWLGRNDVGHDRNWIARDPESGALYVIWQNVPQDSSQVAWSLDEGATWHEQEPDQRPPCYYASTPVVLHGVLRFACVHDEPGGGRMIQTYAFDAETGGVIWLLDGVAEGLRPFFTPLADGTLVLHYDTCTGTTYPPDPPNPCVLDSVLLRSHDGGATWEPAGSALGLAAEDWDRARIYWSAADPFGDQHLLVRYERDEPQLPSDPTERAFVPVVYEARHLVLDASGAVLHGAVLESWRSEVARADEWIPDLEDEGLQSGHPRCAGNSCFNGLAWEGDHGLLAFAHDGAVQLALVTRAGPPAPEFPPVEAPPVRPYVPPAPPSGLAEPVEYSFTGHVNSPYYCLPAGHPAAEDALFEQHSAIFEFEVPEETRFVNATLDWDTFVPGTEGLDVEFYGPEGEYWGGTYSTDRPGTFNLELPVNNAGSWTGWVYNCQNPPTDFTLDVLLS